MQITALLFDGAGHLLNVIRYERDYAAEVMVEQSKTPHPNGVFLRRDYIESGDRITAHYYPASLTVFEWQEDSALVCD